LPRFEFESGTILFCLSFIFVSFGELCLLVSWCAEDRDVRIGRILGGWAIVRLCGVVCGLHRARGEEEREFLG
jgi:hypothetical protein